MIERGNDFELGKVQKIEDVYRPLHLSNSKKKNVDRIFGQTISQSFSKLKKNRTEVINVLKKRGKIAGAESASEERYFGP